MDRPTAIAAYIRTQEWSHRQSEQISAEKRRIFGDPCEVIMHNAVIAWDRGNPWPELVERHGDYKRIARRLEHAQRRVWDTSERLCAAFARYF